MRFYERFCSFCALCIIGKCTSRHLFAYGGLQTSSVASGNLNPWFSPNKSWVLGGKINSPPFSRFLFRLKFKAALKPL